MSIVQTRDLKPAHYDGWRGLGLLDDAVVSKGTAFTEDEREAYGLEDSCRIRWRASIGKSNA